MHTQTGHDRNPIHHGSVGALDGIIQGIGRIRSHGRGDRLYGPDKARDQHALYLWIGYRRFGRASQGSRMPAWTMVKQRPMIEPKAAYRRSRPSS